MIKNKNYLAIAGQCPQSGGSPGLCQLHVLGGCAGLQAEEYRLSGGHRSAGSSAQPTRKRTRSTPRPSISASPRTIWTPISRPTPTPRWSTSSKRRGSSTSNKVGQADRRDRQGRLRKPERLELDLGGGRAAPSFPHPGRATKEVTMQGERNEAQRIGWRTLVELAPITIVLGLLFGVATLMALLQSLGYAPWYGVNTFPAFRLFRGALGQLASSGCRSDTRSTTRWYRRRWRWCSPSAVACPDQGLSGQGISTSSSTSCR